MLLVALTILGLISFEIVSSVDNAIVNAHVLGTMSERSKRWFLLWGIIIAVVAIRGLLPLMIIVVTNPDIGFLSLLRAIEGSDGTARHAMEQNAYILLLGGGMFLFLLYLNWLFQEPKDPYFVPDKLIKPHHGIWFYGIAALLLVGVMYASSARPIGMISVAAGNAIFFILHGFRNLAEQEEKKLAHSRRNDASKLMFLMILDASFSIDGVLGAFAFTTNVLLIFIGNGIGAVVVRQLTMKGINKVGTYKWLKNGAMTSIGMLGACMILEGFDVHIPQWLPPCLTFTLVGITFFSSHRDLRRNTGF